jgi:hypothetical protein
MFRLVLVSLTAAALLAMPAAAEPEEGEWELELREETQWFVCDGSTPEWAANYRLGDDTPTWSLDAPTASFAAGEGGCGAAHPSLVNGTEQESPYNLSFAGDFDGNIDTITVRLHNAYLGTHRDTGSMQMLNVRLTIENLSVYGIQEFTGTDVDGLTFETVTHTGPAIRQLRVFPEPSDHGVTEVFTFHITGIDYLTEEDDALHRIVLTVGTGFNGNNAQNLWAWGATEIASSITFNDPDAESDRFNEAIPRDEREEHDYPG